MQHIVRSRTAKLTACALGAATMAAAAWITLPGSVPVTMQSFVLFLLLLLLDGKSAAASVTVYLLLGAIGLPVFAGMQGGLGVLLGPTGGFLIGFWVMAMIEWGIAAVLPKRGLPTRLCCILAQLFVCYLLGSAWYWQITETEGFLAALGICVLPVLPADIIKLVLAAAVYRSLARRLSCRR